MKIRSSLTERSLYRQRSNPAAARATGRRLSTLLLALILVLLLMQQAGDPEVYRKLFARLGVPMTTPAGIEIQSQPTFLPATPVQTSAVGDFAQLVDRLSDEDRDRLTQRLATIRHRASGTNTSSVEFAEEGEPAEKDSIDSLGATVASAAREAGFANPVAIEQALLSETDVDPDQMVLLRDLQTALDATYLESIEDGTVWNSGDFKAFYRSLQRVSGSDPLSEDPVYVGVVPLIEQSVIYRGRHVRMYGRAVQASLIAAKSNPFDIDAYWMVWLRPTDGSERPVVVYCTEVPAEVAALSETGVADDGPMVDVDGLFLKRYLYRSVGGYDQAPLLVARLGLPQSASAPIAKQNTIPLGSAIAWAVAGAGLIAALVTGIWYWSVRRNELRDRIVRQKRLQSNPPTFDKLD